MFVNFKKDEDNPVIFGKKELFKKIHDFFIESDTYKNSLEVLNDEKLNEDIEKRKALARHKLLPHKIWGGVVGLIPFGDILIQKFIIKKDAIKKAGQIFGIEAKFIDEEKAKEKKIIEEQKKIAEQMKKVENEKEIIKEDNIIKEKEKTDIEGVNIIEDYFEYKKNKNKVNEKNMNTDKNNNEPV